MAVEDGIRRRKETVWIEEEGGGVREEQMELATSIHCFGFFLDWSEAVLQSSCRSPIIHTKRNVCRKSTSKFARKFKLVQSVLEGKSKTQGKKSIRDESTFKSSSILLDGTETMLQCRRGCAVSHVMSNRCKKSISTIIELRTSKCAGKAGSA